MRALWLLTLLQAFPARAGAELTIAASVNKTTVSLDDQVVLHVSISGNSANLPDPRLPPIPNFNVHSAGRSQNISFINGVMSSAIEHTYVLVPRFPGKAVIGPITVDEGGTQAQTQPIEIAILRPSSMPPGGGSGASAASPPGAPAGAPAAAQPQGGGGPDLLVTAETDKQKPFVNEQVILTVRFHTAIPLLGNAEWVPPSANGFISEDLPPGPQQQTTQQGRRYYVSEVKLALFPAQPGRLTIGPSTIRCQVQQEMAVDPFAPDFFQKFFGGSVGVQTRELKSKPITLDVQALPSEGKPPSFSGAVGRYHIAAAADKRALKAGEAINLTVTVEGTGNLKALGELPLPEMKAFRAYDTLTSLNLNKSPAGVRGTKAYKTVIVPKVSGPLRLPPVPLSYFDPERKEYATVQTDPIDIQVAPGAAAAGASYVAPGTGQSSITPLSEDIRYIKDRLREPALSRLAKTAAGLGWLHLIPLCLFAGSLGWSLYQRHLSQNPAATRSRSALPKAQGRIRDARGLLGSDSQRAATLLNDALSGYLADKLNRPASSLTRKQALESLKGRYGGLPDSHLNRLRTLWEELEMLRFAPAGNALHGPDATHLADGLMELIQALEEELK